MEWQTEFEDHRYDYPLTAESVVMDIGAYHGEFSEGIYNKYQCKVYAFEPVESLHEPLQNFFKDNPNVKTYKKGLSDKTRKETIYLAGNATSAYEKVSEDTEVVDMQCIKDFLDEEKLDYIDLVKINIEGGEYPLLDYILSKKLISKFANLQIQFHLFQPGDKEKMDDIKTRLSKTHSLTYEYFQGDQPTWENWRVN